MKIGGVTFYRPDGVSSGAGSGGKVCSGRFLTPINTDYLSPGETYLQNSKINRVMTFRQDLITAASLKALKKLPERHLKAIFNPDRVMVVVNEEVKYPGLKSLIEASLRENRIIYVPNLSETPAVVNGQIPTQLEKLFSAQLPTLGVDHQALQKVPFKSVVVVPLVTGLEEIRPVEEYKRYGALVMVSKKPVLLDPFPFVDIVPLRQYGEDFSLAIEDQLAKKLPR